MGVTTALLSCNRQLALVGLRLRIIKGVVSLVTTEVHNKALAKYSSAQNDASGNLEMTTATLEELATSRDYFNCGPDPMMDAIERALRELGVSLAYIHSEGYNFA